MNAPGPNPGIGVLIADDSAFMRAALSRMVESDPGLYVCATAQRGLEALEQIVALRPDVVTLDVEMPGDPETHHERMPRPRHHGEFSYAAGRGNHSGCLELRGF